MLNMLVIAGIAGAVWYFWPQIKAYLDPTPPPADGE